MRNKSQHHIMILTILFWVWKPSEKTQDGKIDAAVKYRFYYEKILNVCNHYKFTQTWRMQFPAEQLDKFQLNLDTLMCECTSQLYEAR